VDPEARRPAYRHCSEVRADVTNPSAPPGGGGGAPGRVTLVLGGARSGKSAVAEALVARAAPPVTYLATAVADAGDADFAARIEAHRRRRPAGWATVECGADLVAALAGASGTVLVEALGTWVASRPDLVVDGAALCRALAVRRGDTVIVSDEVGLGVHPETEVGRRFRDALGELNQAVAAVAGEVLLVVAGRVVRLERP
jgi:adenosyl cobinamide kinase/adenosyl cobinamide phosphate guanylyltransferase